MPDYNNEQVAIKNCSIICVGNSFKHGRFANSLDLPPRLVALHGLSFDKLSGVVAPLIVQQYKAAIDAYAAVLEASTNQQSTPK